MRRGSRRGCSLKVFLPALAWFPVTGCFPDISYVEPMSDCRTEGCDGGRKCTVIDLQKGAFGCSLAGQRSAWQVCAADGECAAGLWCDLEARVCRPRCEARADCEDGQSCHAAIDAEGVSIPNLQVCTAHCDPFTSAPCGPAANCIANGGGGDPVTFDCAAAGTVSEGAMCELPADCQRGHRCQPFNQILRCRQWCRKPPTGEENNDCPDTEDTCRFFSEPVLRDGQEYGMCTPINVNP